MKKIEIERKIPLEVRLDKQFVMNYCEPVGAYKLDQITKLFTFQANRDADKKFRSLKIMYIL